MAKKKTITVNNLGIKSLDALVELLGPLQDALLYEGARAMEIWLSGLAPKFCEILGVAEPKNYTEFRQVAEDFFGSSESLSNDLVFTWMARQMRKPKGEKKS